MKKSLIAIAVLGAFGIGAAQAADNVQLYGIIDLGVTHMTGLQPASGPNGTQTVTQTGLSSGVQSGSRIGLKGTEDLGGGLNAIFQMETGFCAAGTNQDKSGQTYCTGGGFMQRQSYVGLTGGFGTVMGGRMYSPQFNAEASMDPFGFGMTGDIGNISLVGQYGLARVNQVVAYVSPNFGGFTGTAAYSFAPGASSTVPTSTGNVPRAWTLNGQYANGPITAGANYLRVTNLFNNPNTGLNDGALKLWQIFGGYDFGIAKVTGIYEQAKQDYTSGNNKSWMLGLTVPVGPGAVLASYEEAKNTLGGLTNATAKQYAIGYTYALSKRTNLYTSYAHISNDTNTHFAVGTATDSFTGVAGQSSTGFALGIRHKF